MKTRKNNKLGISLIVLVITIIVMIILAGAVVLTLANSGIIAKANNAVDATDLAAMQDLASMLWAEEYLDKEGKASVGDLRKAVDEGLKEVDENYATKYDLDVTVAGVTVTKKGEGWTQSGHTVTNGKKILTVGDYIDYDSGNEEYDDEDGWRVLGAENGELLIVSATEVVDSLTLGGSTLEAAQASYAGGALTALQTACNPYGSGDKATGVRSIKGEDIDRIAQYDVKTFTGAGYIADIAAAEGLTLEQLLASMGFSDISVLNIMDYGRTITFEWDETDTPVYSYTQGENTVTENLSGDHIKFVWYDEELKVWREGVKATSGAIVDKNDTTKVASVTNNMAGYIGTKLGEDTAAYEMLINDGTNNLAYWLASPCVGVAPDYADFGIREVFDGNVNGSTFVFSDGDYSGNAFGVRAVVSLASNIQLEEVETHYWEIQ